MIGEGLGEGRMQAGGGFRLGSSFQLGTAKPIGGGGGERTRGPTGEADEAAARLAAMERRLEAKMAALDAAIARLEGNQAAMLRREEDALRPELPEPLSGLAFAPENADVLNGTGVETKPESRDHGGGKNDLFRYKLAVSDGEHGFWMPLAFLAGGAGGGGGTWNGKVYDFWGNLLHNFTTDYMEDGKWIIGGTHVRITPAIPSGSSVVVLTIAMEGPDGTGNEPAADTSSLLYKVADRSGESPNFTYTLTDDQAGAIRLPLPLAGAAPYNVLSVNADGKPLFDFVRAHV